MIPTSSLKQFTPTAWRQSLAGSSILAASGHHSGLWRRAELESWDDELKRGQVVFQDDGSTATLPGDSLSIPEYADVSGEDDERGSSEDESELSEDDDIYFFFFPYFLIFCYLKIYKNIHNFNFCSNTQKMVKIPKLCSCFEKCSKLLTKSPG